MKEKIKFMLRLGMCTELGKCIHKNTFWSIPKTLSNTEIRSKSIAKWNVYLT